MKWGLSDGEGGGENYLGISFQTVLCTKYRENCLIDAALFEDIIKLPTARNKDPDQAIEKYKEAIACTGASTLRTFRTGNGYLP